MILNFFHSGRFDAIDASRGFAVLGILFANIYVFGLPYEIVIFPEFWQSETDANILTSTLTNVYVDGVMRAIFSMVFGAAALILLARAEADNRSINALDAYFRRLLWLIVFGLVHAYVLLWPFDILFMYGLFGLALFPFRNLSAGRLATIAAVLLAGSIVLNTQSALFDNDQSYDLTDSSIERIEPWLDGGEILAASQTNQDAQNQDLALQEMEQEIARYLAKIEERIEEKNGTYLDILVSSAPDAFAEETAQVFNQHFLDIMSMFFIGMALLKSGFFNGHWKTSRYVVLALTGFFLGTRLGFLQSFDMPDPDFMTRVTNLLAVYGYDLRRLCFAIAYMSIFVLLVTRAKMGARLVHPFIACGRMALSLYILQTIFCIFFFYGFGLGLYGQLEHVELFQIAMVLTLVQLVLAPIYLRLFKIGPLEALMRSLVQWGGSIPLTELKPATIEAVINSETNSKSTAERG